MFILKNLILKKQILKNINKLKYKKVIINKIFQKILICQVCQGTGIERNKTCNSCSGLGFKHYTYF